jgi:hypothetical protein
MWHIVEFRKIISFEIGIKKYTNIPTKVDHLNLNDFLKKLIYVMLIVSLIVIYATSAKSE